MAYSFPFQKFPPKVSVINKKQTANKEKNNSKQTKTKETKQTELVHFILSSNLGFMIFLPL